MNSPSPEIEAIVREFDEKFCSATSLPKYCAWKATALAYPKDVRKFLVSSLHKLATHIIREIEKGKEKVRHHDDCTSFVYGTEKGCDCGHADQWRAYNQAKEDDIALIKKLIGK